MESTPVVFLIMISIAVSLLVWNLVIPVFGAERQAAKRLKKRLRHVAESENRPSAAGMLRDKYLDNLGPLGRRLESLPGMERLAMMIEQSGRETPAHRLVLLVLMVGMISGITAWYFTNNLYIGLAVALVAAPVPLMKISFDRAKRLAKFEEQLNTKK